MPNFLVVRCCNCNIFQVQQENKKRKFSCKICNYKQSVLRIYLESTNPSNCRAHVQECNTKIIPLLEEKKKLKSILNYGNYDEKYQNSGNRTIDSYFKRDKTKDPQKWVEEKDNYVEKRNSHWNMYLSESDNNEDEEDSNLSKNGKSYLEEKTNNKINNNSNNEKEEEMARELIEKIAQSILKNDDDKDTESSQEENNWSEDDIENKNNDVIEIKSNSALNSFLNRKNYTSDGIYNADIQNVQKNQISMRNSRKRNIVYDKNDILIRSNGQRDLTKYQNKYNKRLKYSLNDNTQYQRIEQNQNYGFINSSSFVSNTPSIYGSHLNYHHNDDYMKNSINKTFDDTIQESSTLKKEEKKKTLFNISSLK